MFDFIFNLLEPAPDKAKRIANYNQGLTLISYDLDFINTHPKIRKNIFSYKLLILNIQDFIHNSKPQSNYRLNNEHSIKHDNKRVTLLKNAITNGDTSFEQILSKSQELDIGPRDLERISNAILCLLKESKSFKRHEQKEFHCCDQRLILKYNSLDLVPYEIPSNDW